MDPEDQVKKRGEAEKAGLRVIGWYHSHPTFKAIPSTIDIYNQVLQQHAHREDGYGTTAYSEPYIAAIVSPYDRSVPSPMSTINWFYVSHAPGAVPAEGQRPNEVGCIAKALATERVYEPLGPLENLQVFQREMEHLATRYAQILPDRANLEAPWVDGSLVNEKIVNSLLSRLRGMPLEDAKLSKFEEKLYFSTRAVWNVYGKPLISGKGVAAVAAATASAGGGGGVPPSSALGTVTGSAPVSTAVSQEGGGNAVVVGDNETGDVSGHQHAGDADEPISEDDETEDES